MLIYIYIYIYTHMVMKLPGTDQIPAEQIKAGGRTIHSEIHKLHNFMWKVSRTVPIYKKGDRLAII